MSEKRAVKRKATHTPVILHLDGAPPLRVDMIDITDIGMGLASENPLPVGRRAKASMDLFFNGRSHKLEVSGHTVYSMYSSRYGFKIGVNFDDLPPDVRQVLLKYLDY